MTMGMDRRKFIAVSTAAGAVSIVGITGAATAPNLRHDEMTGALVRLLFNGEPVSKWHPIKLTVIDDVITPSDGTSVAFVPLDGEFVSWSADGWEIDIPGFLGSFKFDAMRTLTCPKGATICWG